MLEITDLEALQADVIHMRERLVISPGDGRFHPLPPETITTEGEWISRGQTIAEIRNGRESWPVESFCEGWLMGMLAVPGSPVSKGEALFWIRT